MDEIPVDVGFTVEKYSPKETILFMPNMMEYADFNFLARVFPLLSRYFHQLTSPTETLYWRVLCNAFLQHSGLHCPLIARSFRLNLIGITQIQSYRKHFLDNLWPYRTLWKHASGEAANDDVTTSYKIKVACRMRPGSIGDEKVCLPLRQFLKVKKSQLSSKSAEEASTTTDNNGKTNNLLVGESDPEAFVDPFLGVLMREPVLLTSSQKICDRSVALQCVLRRGRDPFNNKRLTVDMLVPQPELLAQIQQWKQSKIEKRAADVSLDVKQVMSTLVDIADMNPEILEALMEVKRMKHVLHRARIDADRDNVGASDTVPEEEDGPANVEGVPNEEVVAHLLGEEQVQQWADTIGNTNGAGTATGASREGDSAPDLTSSSQRKDFVRIVDVNEEKAAVSMHVPGLGVRPFLFNRVFDGSSSQESVFEKTVTDTVSAVMTGFNACILCYGQTGSGKTYTFFGPDEELGADELLSLCDNNNLASSLAECLPRSTGLVVRNCVELLAAKECMAARGFQVSLSAKFIEIYEEQVIDLISGRNVSVRRETGEVSGAVESSIDSLQEAMTVLRTGHARKRFAATAMNDRSSRSHTLFIVQVMQKCNAAEGRFSGDKMIRSQLHLVDLAGSERVKKSQVGGVRLREAVGINSSLLVLGKVINALVEAHVHVPYYESKLTILLKAAFGGNSRTTAIVNCRADPQHGDETLQTMRFAERCSLISNAMRQAAGSYQAALTSIDSALAVVREQLISLEARNKQQLPSYRNLVQSFEELTRRRTELITLRGEKDKLQEKAATLT